MKTTAAAKAPAARPARSRKAAPPAVPVAAPSPSVSAGTDGPPLSVLMIVPEAYPYASTGGLAEVTGGLPLALGRLGHRVTLVLPRYRGIDVSGAEPLAARVQVGEHAQDVIFHTRAAGNGVTAVFVDIPALFDRDGLYSDPSGADYPDNAWRFAVFARAALEYARLRGERPSVIHAHDWQTGAVPVFQKMHLSPDPVVGGVPAIFTIHNLAFQGLFPSSTIPALGLGWEVLDVQALEYWGQISFLKGGINFSERITTVSPTYAREILTPELGFGLEGSLARRADALTGILNGIDLDEWNPASDDLAGGSFTVDDLSGKAAARRGLLEAAGLPADLPASTRPVIGLLTRLTEQKGLDLIAAAAEELMALDATWVVLGSGDRKYEAMWTALAAQYPHRVSVTIGFDRRLAHRIIAGSDIFLMPSYFEPCGLNQMYSARYGTVPVVRATGGLDDTVRDASEPGGNGFKFRDYTPEALVSSLQRALALYRTPQEWLRIQRAGMKHDYSWDASAREYVKVYRDAAGTAPVAG
ncbi:MAG: glycogen synthase GlgA [Acidobacteriota bacterium]